MTDEQILLVTGGGRGIGAATARLAGSAGYAVCVGYLNHRAAALEVVEDIRSRGARAIAVPGNVADENDVLRLFETVDEQLGALTALVNNAGILDIQMRVEQMSAARLDRIFAVNVTGAFLCAREAVKRMSTRHGGAGGCIRAAPYAAIHAGDRRGGPGFPGPRCAHHWHLF